VKTEETTEILVGVLHEVAPDADLSTLAPDADLRESLELDSLDFLRVVELLSEQTGHDIREDEYPRLATFASTVEFLNGG
jgi:acyl carrier protein